jgi:hypothetical protein
MSQNKPKPLFVARKRKQCPVCGEAAFSREGIHPQCAQKQADDKRVARLKLKKKREKKATPQRAATFALKSWHKRCPKCRSQVHVRKSVCDCGFAFNAVSPVASDSA